MMAKNKTGTRDQPSHRFHLRLGYDVTRRLGKRVACGRLELVKALEGIDAAER